jgi:hypothetical protein
LIELGEFDIPRDERRRLEAEMRQLHSRRAGLLRELSECERMEASRSRARAAARAGASKRRRPTR